MATSLDQLKANLELYQYQPALVQKDALDLLNSVSNGEITVVDASNPFVFSMECSAVHVTAFMEKDATLMRRLYASNSQTPDDVYFHMSDWDFINVFCKPSRATFGFAFSKDEILSKLVTDTTTGIKKLVIPRNTKITVSNTVFTLQYPVEIRQMLHGGLQVVYDASKVSPLQELATNVINWEVRRAGNLDMIYFELDISQFNIKSLTGSATAATSFKLTYKLTDQYFYTRVWMQSSDGTTWTELSTTMTPDVLDVTTPTAVIKVLGSQVTVEIPQIYTLSGQVTGKIRCDFYESKGDLTLDLGAYPTAAFQAEWTAVDKNDLTIYSAPMDTLSTYVIMGNSVTLGGTNGLTFAELRKRVINNAVGPINLPITNVQLEAALEDDGYSVVKNVDNITNRTFLATKPMPVPTNSRLITAAAASIETVTTSMTALSLLPTVVDNGSSLTITPDTLYKNVSGIVKVAPSSEIAALLALPPTNRALAINQAQYYYTPFHYVLDASGDEFDVRPYYLDGPQAVTTTFISENDSTLLQVATGAYSLTRTTTGYQLTIRTNSGDTYKALPDSQVFVQLAYIPYGENDYAYINGVLQGLDPTTKERIFTFDLSTTFNVDANNYLELTKFLMFTTDARITKAALTTQFDILYSTTAVMDAQWKAADVDKKLGRFLLPSGIVGITNEQIRLKFGDALTTLWARARSVIGDIPYKTYATDVPALYPSDVYQTDANGSYVTFDTQGNPVITVLHHQGDPVLDNSGNPIYAHRAGDVILDGSGKPIVGGTRDLLRQLDIMMLEGAYYFATDSVALGYRQELITNVLAWLLNELEPLNNTLLEQTHVYFYPKSTQGNITVINQSGLKVGINAGQSLEVTLYVTPQVFQNDDVRNQLTVSTVKTLAAGLDATTVSHSAMEKALSDAYAGDVIDLELKGLGGSNMPVFTVLDSSTRCGLRKILVAQGDNSLIVSEDVTVIFVAYDNSEAK